VRRAYWQDYAVLEKLKVFRTRESSSSLAEHLFALEKKEEEEAVSQAAAAAAAAAVADPVAGTATTARLVTMRV